MAVGTPCATLSQSSANAGLTRRPSVVVKALETANERDAQLSGLPERRRMARERAARMVQAAIRRWKARQQVKSVFEELELEHGTEW